MGTVTPLDQDSGGFSFDSFQALVSSWSLAERTAILALLTPSDQKEVQKPGRGRSKSARGKNG